MVTNVKQTEAKLEFKSPAEFFANNKNIAGFDNVSELEILWASEVISPMTILNPIP